MIHSQIDTAGLFRCCVQSILDDEGPDEEGRTIGCKFHEDPDEPVAVFRDDEWHWANPGDDDDEGGD